MKNQATAMIIISALVMAFLFQIEWMFFLAIALTAIVLLTQANPAGKSVKHEEKNETEETTEADEDEAADDEEEKEQLIIVKQPVHQHQSESLQHKIDEEIIGRALAKPWEHIEHNWWKGTSPSYGHKPRKKGDGKKGGH